ncbi:MAG: zinc ribbon domain-containing protein [Defluviitaleaceae bacterium]|nr:zinc ribbon domain-containing protein [Defluviitaleaceae bacterium]
MPNYNLYCTECKGEHRIWASMTEKSEKRISCPDCGSFEMETVFKAPPAYLKGGNTAPCPNRVGCGNSCPHAG